MVVHGVRFDAAYNYKEIHSAVRELQSLLCVHRSCVCGSLILSSPVNTSDCSDTISSQIKRRKQKRMARIPHLHNNNKQVEPKRKRFECDTKAS